MAKRNKRPSIVALLGHVDHGKTTLLDAIRKTDVQKKEAGGITQNIGASVITTKEGNKITFIDTPGHAAFKSMRSQGATVSDIALLIVASDDGVKPQTKEAISIIKESQISYIVVITKTDAKGANIESVKSQLEKEEVFLEGRGGDTPVIEVSATNNKGLTELLEMIILVSDVKGVWADPEDCLEAIVIETAQSKGGVLATVVVRNGTIEKGKKYFAERTELKVRGLVDDKGKCVEKALPGDPVQILGFSELPLVGSVISEEIAKGEDLREKKIVENVGENEIGIVVKTSSLGCLSAIKTNISKMAKIISSGVGDVTENDIFVAKSASSLVFAFEVKVPNSVSKLAEMEGVKVFEYKIVYKLFEKIEEILKTGEKKILGRAKIMEIFPFNNQRVAGSRVSEGEIRVGDRIEIMSGDSLIGSARVVSVRKNKDNLEKAIQGMECGVLFEPQLDFGEGDVIVSIAR